MRNSYAMGTTTANNEDIWGAIRATSRYADRTDEMMPFRIREFTIWTATDNATIAINDDAPIPILTSGFSPTGTESKSYNLPFGRASSVKKLVVNPATTAWEIVYVY